MNGTNIWVPQRGGGRRNYSAPSKKTGSLSLTIDTGNNWMIKTGEGGKCGNQVETSLARSTDVCLLPLPRRLSQGLLSHPPQKKTSPQVSSPGHVGWGCWWDITKNGMLVRNLLGEWNISYIYEDRSRWMKNIISSSRQKVGSLLSQLLMIRRCDHGN